MTTDNYQMKGIEDALDVAAGRVLAGVEPSQLRRPVSPERFLAAYRLSKSGRRLEELTKWLIGVTVMLAVLTGVLVPDVVKRLLDA